MTSQRQQRLLRWQRRLTAFTTSVGHFCAWFSIAMVILMVLVVVLRYAFGIGSIALQESITYLHSALFMMAAAYTLALDEHVRVDLLYQKFSARGKAWVDLLGTLFLLFPVCVAIFVLSFNYVMRSWEIHEVSNNGGLPFVYVLKTLLLVMPSLLVVQGIADVIRHGLFLAGFQAPEANRHDEGATWS